ncbi:MAG TPA: hypothetical protein VNK92_03855 [Vicinamibacterales bacterium]|nr:hypothetical protein [Vicinamibacterales bacterium]
MEIRFVSSLTPDDENVLAPALIRAVGALLDPFPIAYTLRVETSGGQVFQHWSIDRRGRRQAEVEAGERADAAAFASSKPGW